MAKHSNNLALVGSKLASFLSSLTSYVLKHDSSTTSFDTISDTFPLVLSNDEDSFYAVDHNLKSLYGIKGTYAFDIGLIKDKFKLDVTPALLDAHFTSYADFHKSSLSSGSSSCRYPFVFSSSSLDNYSRDDIFDLIRSIRQTLLKFSSPCARLDFILEVDLGSDSLSVSLDEDLYVSSISQSLDDSLSVSLDEDLYVSSISQSLDDSLSVSLDEPFIPSRHYVSSDLRTFYYKSDTYIATHDVLLYSDAALSEFILNTYV